MYDSWCLSFPLAGSQYAGVVTFEVQKGEGLERGTGEIVSVTIPRELRGRSEIAVFLSKLPVKGIYTTSLHTVLKYKFISSLFPGLMQHRRSIPGSVAEFSF